MDEPEVGAFEYANVTGRASAPLVVALAKALPGVATVQRQHARYAREWRAANLAALAQPGPRWVIFGDSMSLGVGASSYDAGWVNRVRDRLRLAGFEYELVNLAANGARASDVLQQQIPAWRGLPPPPAEAASAASAPDLVSLLIGSNDLLTRQHRDRLPGELAQVLAHLPDGAVVATLPQPRRAARAANDVIAAVDAARGLTVVDMRTRGPRSWRGRLAEDHFHPNDAGYAGLADAFFGPMRNRAADVASLSD